MFFFISGAPWWQCWLLKWELESLLKVEERQTFAHSLNDDNEKDKNEYLYKRDQIREIDALINVEEHQTFAHSLADDIIIKW